MVLGKQMWLNAVGLTFGSKRSLAHCDECVFGLNDGDKLNIAYVVRISSTPIFNSDIMFSTNSESNLRPNNTGMALYPWIICTVHHREASHVGKLVSGLLRFTTVKIQRNFGMAL